MAYESYRRSLCPQCGTREAEWDPDLGGDPYAYTAIGHKCFGCEELEREQHEISKASGISGMKVLLMPASVQAAQEVQQHYAH